MAILLTGVGYIGAALLRRLADRQPRQSIVALENFFCTPRQDVERVLPPDATLVVGDVAETADVAHAFAAVPRDEELTVFHLAAQPSAGIAVRDPETTERSNLTGARLVLEAARERKARVVFGGSFRVYGDDLVGQTVTEDTPYGAVGDLSHLSKIYVEHLARMLRLRFVSVRLGVTYGLSPIMKTEAVFMTVPNLFCQRAVKGEPLQVLDDRPLGLIHVADAADALLAAARFGEASGAAFSAVNAAPQVASVGQVARLVEEAMRRRGEPVTIEGQTTSDSGYLVRSHLETLEFQPRHVLANSLDEVLDYFAQVSR